MDDGAVQVAFLDELGGEELVDSNLEDYKGPEDKNSDEYKRYVADSNLYGHVMERWAIAQRDRTVREEIDLDSWKNYRGEYSGKAKEALAEAQQRDPSSSDIFVKITKTKVLAAYGQLLEILEGDNRFPISIERTPVPDGIPSKVFVERTETEYAEDKVIDVYGHKGDGNTVEPGATHNSLLTKSLKNMKSLITGDRAIKEGESPDQTTAMEIDPGKEAAAKMDKLIQDQLQETNALQHLEDSAFENTLFGTGILKGPFTSRVEVPNWTKNDLTQTMDYTPTERLSPKISWVSKWNLYPDPSAKNVDDCEFIIERHRINAPQLRKLADQPGFNASAVMSVLQGTPNHEREDWEEVLRDDSYLTENSRYNVLEFWGYIDTQLAAALNLEVSDVNKHHVMVNAWVCNNEILKLSLNPLLPQRFPYHVVQFEKQAYQFWGIGVAENMDDVQQLMNGHMRMSVDNLRLAGSAVFEIDENILAPGQDMSIYPGKIFYKQNGAPGQGLHSISFNNTAGSHIQMYDKARQLADEKTGIPSYSHGQTGVTGTTRTASGMSMLMGAATLSTKTVTKNWDVMLERLGEMMFSWNMQYNNELPEEMQDVTMGDLMIKASGTSSFMQKEVRSQRLLQLMQIMAQNPMFNMEWALKEIAKAMDLDPNDAINDPQAAALYAELMQKAQQNVSQSDQGAVSGSPSPSGPQSGNGAQAPNGPANPSDPTGSGGGTIGTGTAPAPGESGFSANTQ